MATHDEIYSEAARLGSEDLDAFFDDPLPSKTSPPPTTTAAPAAPTTTSDGPGANLDDMMALQGPTLLNLSTHLRRVNDLVYKFHTAPLAQSPALLANVFSSKNDLSVVLQHDLFSAWASRAQAKVPDCIMKQLYVLTFMAPDSVLAAEASRCSVQIFEQRQATYLPPYAAVAKALDYFGAPPGLLFDASIIAQQLPAPTNIGGSPPTSSFLSSSIVSKWSTLSGWLQFLTAAFNAHECPRRHLTNDETNDDDAYPALHKIVKSLLLLSADAEIQRNCQFECCGAVNAALRVYMEQKRDTSVLEGVLHSVVATDATLLSTPALAHMASFLTHNAVASKFAHMCLSARLPSHSLPWLDEMLCAKEHEVPLEELGRVLDAMIEGLEKGNRANNAFSVQLLPKFASLAAFVTLLHTLCAASGAAWDKKTRKSFRQKCEALKNLLEDKLQQKCLVAEVCQRLALAADVLEFFDQSSKTLAFLR